MDELNEMEPRLWEYIDGLGTSSERLAIRALIEQNEAWKARYAELLHVHQLLLQSELEEPSLRFTRNVMEEIAQLQIHPAARRYINKKVIWGIASFFFTIILGFLVYGFGLINWSSAADPQSFIGLDFSKVEFSRMFDNSYINAFMMLNILLGLMLLDRYLNARRQKWMEESKKA